MSVSHQTDSETPHEISSGVTGARQRSLKTWWDNQPRSLGNTLIANHIVKPHNTHTHNTHTHTHTHTHTMLESMSTSCHLLRCQQTVCWGSTCIRCAGSEPCLVVVDGKKKRKKTVNAQKYQTLYIQHNETPIIDYECITGMYHLLCGCCQVATRTRGGGWNKKKWMHNIRPFIQHVKTLIIDRK